MKRALAIDLGGTNVRAGIGGPKRPEIVEPVGRWDAPANLPAFERLLGELIEKQRVNWIGLAVPGLAVDATCVWIPNLPFLDGVDLSRLFPDVAIKLGNDAQFALLAEATAGAAKGLTDAILLSIGTGVGSAVLSGGRILRGARGGAASFGWACADVSDPGSDRDGWLERQVSGRALDALAGSVGLDSGRMLIEKARAGDRQALQLLEGPAHALGATLAGAVALTDPQAVIITGGVAAALDVMTPLIQPALSRQLPAHLRDVRLISGAFGPGASLAGASVAAYGSDMWDG